MRVRPVCVGSADHISPQYIHNLILVCVECVNQYVPTQPRFRAAFRGGELAEFDLLLAAIPLTLLAGIVSAYLLPVPSFVGITLGAVLTGTIVGYGICAIMRLRHPPTRSRRSMRE